MRFKIILLTLLTAVTLNAQRSQQLLISQGASAAAASCGSTAPVFVQQGVITTSTGYTSGNLPAPVTAGNYLVGVLSTTTGQSDGGEAIYVGGVQLNRWGGSVVDNGTVSVGIHYGPNFSGGEQLIEVLNSSMAGRVSAWVGEFSGMTLGLGPEDQNTKTGSSTTVTTNSVLPVSGCNLIVAGAAWSANNYSIGPTNLFNRGTATGGAAVYQEAAYLPQLTATAKTTGWGLSGSLAWASTAVAFRGN